MYDKGEMGDARRLENALGVRIPWSFIYLPKFGDRQICSITLLGTIRENMMKKLKQLRRTFTVSLIVLIGIGITGGLRAQERTVSRDEAANLSAKDILEKVRLAYASLSTYRDTGSTVHLIKDHAWTNTFSELLEAPTRYRIEITSQLYPPSETNYFWCDGRENYFQMGRGPTGRSSEISGNLLGPINDTCTPAVYFRLLCAMVFIGPNAEWVRKPDETVGGENCYVVERSTPDVPVTVWVAKRDFLIRRCQMSNRIETHENIRTNEVFQAEDYVPVNLRGNR